MRRTTGPISEKPNTDPAAKLRVLRTPVTPVKRALSVSRVSRRKSPAVPKKPDRRCQSWSSSTQLVKSPVDQMILSGPDGIDPHTYQMLKDAEGKNLTLPQCVMAKLLRVLSSKKREFVKLRKTLVTQQNQFLETYAQLRELETRVGAQPDDLLGQVNVLNVSGWPAHDLLLFVRNDIDLTRNDGVASIYGYHVLEQISAQLNPIPEELLSICSELMVRRIELINSMRSKHRMDRISNLVTPRNSTTKSKTTPVDEETENLHKMVAGAAENMRAKIKYVLDISRIAWLDRDSMTHKIERLHKENLILQSKLDDMTAKESGEPPTPQKPPTNEDICEELSKERAAHEALKEVVASAEAMLRAARTRIANLERHLKEHKTELDTLKKKHRDMEQLVNIHATLRYRHRETSYDARSRKLLEVSKSGEVTIDTLSRQRDALELRVKELREQAAQAELAAQARLEEQRSRIDSLQAKVAKQVAEQEKMKIASENRIAELQTKIQDLETQLETLKQHSTALLDLDRKHCLDFVPPKENEPSAREIEIWKELHETRLALSYAREELRQSKADKDTFLKSLARIAQENDSDKVQQNIAIELINKEKEIAKLQSIIEQQREKEKSTNQNLTKYENELSALRLEVACLRNYDCYTKEIPYKELHTELLELQMRVETLNRERKALATAAASRALMLERHERSAEFFARMIRMRRDFCAHVNESVSSTPPAEAVNRVEMSRSLSLVCAGAANTWSSLRAERAQVLRLESIVMKQNNQLEREAQVRTQLEKQRTVLEREVMRVYHTVDETSSMSTTTSSLLI